MWIKIVKFSKAQLAKFSSVTGFTILVLALSVVFFNHIPLSQSKATILPHLVSTNHQDEAFLAFMRKTIALGKPIAKDSPALEEIYAATSFPKEFEGFALIFYTSTQRRIVVVRREKSEIESIRRVLNRSIEHPRMKDFDILNVDKVRIQMDIILNEPREIKFERLQLGGSPPERFEIGVDGLRLSTGKKTRYFFPGDAFVKSILGKGQLTRYLKKNFKETPLSKVHMSRFNSVSVVSFGTKWLPLFRGIPLLGTIDRESVEVAAREGVEYLARTQAMNGKYMYYYDATNDSFRNHEHPRRDPKKNPYYNILRHSGGGVLFLYHYKVYKEEAMLEHAKRGIEFLIEQIKKYEGPNGIEAGHVFYNTKSKLGGSGIGLYLLSEYQELTGDDQYQEYATLLKEHLVNEIRESGEFYYYHIYPGREKSDRSLFSFYYPGEALIGLATYYKYIADDSEKERLREKMHKALRFLLVDRKDLYAEHYQSLPSDSWLMMAINELWDIPEMRKDLYKEFVFEDADQMVKLTYKSNDAMYPDYVGSFYYYYGDHPYPDGARAEGLVGAYELAVKLDDQERIKRYGHAIKAVSWATLHLVNTPSSSYFAPNPDMTIGGIRFKLTRQWFRVDTIQHVAAFYLKFLPYWKQEETFDPGQYV